LLFAFRSIRTCRELRKWRRFCGAPEVKFWDPRTDNRQAAEPKGPKTGPGSGSAPRRVLSHRAPPAVLVLRRDVGVYTPASVSSSDLRGFLLKWFSSSFSFFDPPRPLVSVAVALLVSWSRALPVSPPPHPPAVSPHPFPEGAVWLHPQAQIGWCQRPVSEQQLCAASFYRACSLCCCSLVRCC
jgi:hypothetical protein